MLHRKIGVLLIVGASGLCALAQTINRPHKIDSDRLQKMELPSWKWTKEAWTGDDKPFIAIRNDIDTAVVHAPTGKLSALVHKYEAVALKKPADAKAQFAWGYAAVRARKAGYDFSDRQWGVPLNISFNLAEVPSPRSYQYNRLRFLVALWWREFPQLKGLGFRLLRRNAQDYDVKYYLTRILSSGNDSEQQKAIGYAQDLVRMQPKRPSAYEALGSACWLAFRGTDNRAIADKSIAAYRKYLQLIPANDKSRPQVESLIKVIQEQKAKGKDWWKGQG
jgi:hypothetical protein